MQGWRPMNGSRVVYQKKKRFRGISLKNLGRGFFFLIDIITCIKVSCQ